MSADRKSTFVMTVGELRRYQTTVPLTISIYQNDRVAGRLNSLIVLTDVKPNKKNARLVLIANRNTIFQGIF